MPQTRKNKVQVPINSDAWNLVPDLTTMADTANVITKVASQAERDAIPSPAHGDKVARTDQYGSPINTYDTGAGGWVLPYRDLGSVLNTFTNWNLSGHFYGIPLGDRMLVQANILLNRINSAITLNSGQNTYSTLGQIIPNAALSGLSVSECPPMTWRGYNAGSGQNSLWEFYLDCQSGTLNLRGEPGGSSSTQSWAQNSQTQFSISYMA